MGRKMTNAAIMCGMLSSAVYIGAFILPLHQVSFFTGVTRLAVLSIHPVWVTFEANGNDFCHQFPVHYPGADHGVAGSYDREVSLLCPGGGRRRSQGLQETAHRWCSIALKTLWPQFCRGVELAYVFGIFVLIVVVVNATMLQGIASYLLYDYMYRKPTRKTRAAARSLLIIGAFMVATVLLMYLLGVTIQMDTMGSGRLGALGFLFATSDATGFGYGQYLLWTALLLQLVQLMLFAWIKGYGEDEYEEAKLAKEEEKLYGAMAGDHGGVVHSGMVWGVAPMPMPALAPPPPLARPPPAAKSGTPGTDFGLDRA